jgi:hypothetical protein
MARVVRFTGVTLIVLGVLFFLGALYPAYEKGGVSLVLERLSPFNLGNILRLVLCLAPGILLLTWSDRLGR